jgi:hypothetical protein
VPSLPEPPAEPGNDHVPGHGALLGVRRFLTKETVGDHGRTLHQIDSGAWESFYRDRWSYDRVVRSTHGVNCTGSFPRELGGAAMASTPDRQEMDLSEPDRIPSARRRAVALIERGGHGVLQGTSAHNGPTAGAVDAVACGLQSQS